MKKPARGEISRHWTLDPEIVYLNHGSFGATPIPVLQAQSELRARMEREPVLFLARQLEGMLDGVREQLAAFLSCDPDGLAFVPNATAGVNAVVRSLDLDKHDELLVTDHEYNACRNVLDYAAGLAGAKVVVVSIPFAGLTEDRFMELMMAAVTDRTRLVLVDHVTSQTAVINPVARLIIELTKRGIDTLVDGAHAPGMIPLGIDALGAAYYTGNLHKWVCAPKGAAFLWVRRNRRASVRPVSISHGANSTRTDRSSYLLEFDWTGTVDPTGWLVVPDALRFLGALLPGGWPQLMQENRSLALRARDVLCRRLGIAHPVPDSMIGSMAAVTLPDGDASIGLSPDSGPLQDALFARHGIEVPIMPWPAPPHRLLRISAQIYNNLDEMEYLANALTEELAAES